MGRWVRVIGNSLQFLDEAPMRERWLSAVDELERVQAERDALKQLCDMDKVQRIQELEALIVRFKRLSIWHEDAVHNQLWDDAEELVTSPSTSEGKQ